MADSPRRNVRCGSESCQPRRDHLKSCRGLAIAVLVSCELQPGCAEARGPSTPGERVRFAALVRSLESNPLSENANAIRQQLRDWVIEVPDIRFKRCPALLGDSVGNKYPYSREVTLQVVLSGAVLTIEHPGEARDDVAVYKAGVEGALRAYGVLVKSTPDAHLAALDDLVEKRDRGELRDHIARLAEEKCAKSNTQWIAAPIGAAAGLVLALVVSHWFGGRGSRVQARLKLRNSARTARIFRKIVVMCAAYYMLVGIALHFLEPEYDPRFHFMSDYVWGAYGWLMTTTFFVLGLAVLAVAIGVQNVHQPSWSARVGVGLLVIGGLFVCLAGVFRGFPLHDVASAVGIPSIVMAVLLLSWSFRKASGWQVVHPATVLIAVGMFAAVVSMIVDVGMPGLQQRAFLFLLLLWLCIVVHGVVRVTARRVQRPSPPRT
jgi:hypothetical membrane protein